MKKIRNLLFIVLTIYVINPTLAQKEMLSLLQKQELKLYEVENYLKNNNINPLQCEELEETTASKSIESSTTYFRDSEGIYVFNIYFHILNENSGERAIPVNENDLMDAVAILNTCFNPFKIFFRYKGFDEINSTWKSVVYLGGDRTFNQLVDYAKSINKYQNDSFNVFIVSTIRRSQYDDSKIAGVANKPGINSVIDDEYILTSTLPHEIGHNFLLHHTYNNWNSTNCDLVIQNDMVDDTLPSIEYSKEEIAEDCSTYIGDQSKISCNRSITQVPATNFMSSLVLPCRSLDQAVFTKGQGERMRQSIQERIASVYMNVQNTVESLYEPCSGEYPSGIYNPNDAYSKEEFKFQKGFDYQFVDCINTKSIVKSYSVDEIPEAHPFYTAIKILQVSETRALNCNIPRPVAGGDQTIISFGERITSDYSVKKVDNLRQENKELMEMLPFGYNLIRVKLRNGKTYQRIVYKNK
ncbi:hypothetical protein ACQY1Q_01290 [Tenacibaculum sp. TC6]|uniref:hypothetical protein n=1 Tax=Tenacibaculum sp. TC6 TaxID=3423223 RepID=UPI003D36F255